MAKGKQTTNSPRSFLRNYGLGITLLGLFLASWLGQLVLQMIEFRSKAEEHGQEFQFIDFLPAFGSATLENWQSEFLQLLMFVVLTSFLIFKGSPESRDGDEEVQQKLDAIQRDLKALRAAQRDAATVESPVVRS